MNKLTYFPGCSAHGTSEEFDSTLKLVMKTLDVQLDEIPDWNCCGATSAHVMTENLAFALPLRNLVLAEKLDNKTMGIACASCYSRMKVTKKEMDEHPDLAQRINSTIIEEGEYKGSVDVQSMLQYCYETIGLEKIKSKVTKSLAGLKVACYYGCLLVRPHEILKFDREEDPQTLDVLMLKAGATPIDWAFKTECCGAGLSVSRTKSVGRLSGKIMGDAKDRGAEAVIVACPMCHSNLDMRREEINTYLGEKIDMPVLYITQAIGLAIGLDRKALGLQRHFVKVTV